ncbi:interferon lambda-4-like [Rhinolophus sinicus]|uniref:interferon lambda-4-like n=1 Tax=Rhinolophus sinicus TaxID=89399 RepID=UPI003D7AAE2C
MVHTTLDASQGTVKGRPRSSTRHPGHFAGAEMGPNGAAAVAVGLWFSVTVSVAAGPDVAAPRRCILSHYRSLDPRALAAVKALRDRYEEETLSWRPRNCSFRPRRDPPRPSSCARLRHVARGLADAQAVLKSLPSPELFPGVPPTLELLAAAGRDVAACLQLVRPGSWRKSLRSPRRRPKTRRADSPRCHEATVIFNLVRLLTWDLRLVAHPGPCL